MSPLLSTARRALIGGAQHLGLSQGEIDRLLTPERTLEANVSVEIDKTQRIVRAWRVQHNLARGPGKGGVRYSPSVSRDEVTGLATIMSMKNALASLPFGGAKGGVEIEPADLDDESRRRLAHALADAFGSFVGPEIDILGPDVGTGELDMAAFAEAWGESGADHPDAVATGKPIDAGGIDLRDGATARGCAQAIVVARDRAELGTDARVAIQGFGALGRELARLLAEAGHPIVALSDSGGGVHDADGLDLDDVIEAKAEEGSVAAAMGEAIGSIDVLTVDADIVVPAALQSVVDVDVADRISARLVVEGANGPITGQGDTRLRNRGVTVVPDFAANAGGVIGSFHEWKANVGDPTGDPEAELIERMRELNCAMWHRSESDGVHLRTAAAAIAIERILDR